MKQYRFKSKEEKWIGELEKEVAQLWYEKIMSEMKISESEKEISELWYAIISGGVE